MRRHSGCVLRYLGTERSARRANTLAGRAPCRGYMPSLSPSATCTLARALFTPEPTRKSSPSFPVKAIDTILHVVTLPMPARWCDVDVTPFSTGASKQNSKLGSSGRRALTQRKVDELAVRRDKHGCDGSQVFPLCVKCARRARPSPWATVPRSCAE